MRDAEPPTNPAFLSPMYSGWFSIAISYLTETLLVLRYGIHIASLREFL